MRTILLLVVLALPIPPLVHAESCQQFDDWRLRAWCQRGFPTDDLDDHGDADDVRPRREPPQTIIVVQPGTVAPPRPLIHTGIE